MNKNIDCLIIGHNEMCFVEYEKYIRKMGTNSCTYRDLNLNFITYKNRPYPISEIFNLFCCNGDFPGEAFSLKPLKHGEIFSATIAYLGTFLNRAGLTFDYVNSFQNEKKELLEKLKQKNILTIAITTTYYVFALPILEIVHFIREYNQEAKIIIGGPFMATQNRFQDSLSFQYLLKNIGADFYVISSQGEAALVKIIKSLKNNLPLNQINNIYYQLDNRYISTPILREDNKLSENMVNWDLFADRIGEYVDIRTSISCPFSCAFCGFPQHAGKFQTAGVEDIEKELNQLQKIASIRGISFIDDTLNVPQKRFKEILKMMVKNKYKFKWISNLRCQFADREMIELMKTSGCEGVFLGIESGSNQMLKKMNKSATVEKYLQGIALLKELQILTFGSFIIGFPGETHDTVQDTIDFIKESGIDFYRTHLWYCDPITPIWKEKEKFNIKGDSFEWSHATMNSNKASDLIENIFMSVENALWIPQYNFELDNLWHLIHRGLNLKQINHFIKSFNSGIKQKLVNPSYKEISQEIVEKLKNSSNKNSNHHNSMNSEKYPFNDFGVKFDF